MKIAIHNKMGTFSERWITYCKEHNMPYKIVNAYDSDIIEQLNDCDAFIWHHHHADYRDVLFAKQLLFALQMSGKKVFPDFNTTWHFDDKVGQKYLLEGIGAPLVPSYVFYTKKEALKWVEDNEFPKVFKLRGGAGASNVELVRNKVEAKRLINKAFGRGFSQFNRIGYFEERFNKWRNGKDTLLGVCKGFGRLIISTNFAKMHSAEKGYVYFQDFIPNNEFDIRVIVIGDHRAFAIKRNVRNNDFRASGSGNIFYAKSEIDERCVSIAFNMAKKLESQSVGFDFVFDRNIPLIVEMSYGFSVKAYRQCEGYWSSDMQWHPGTNFDIEGWMIEDIIKK